MEYQKALGRVIKELRINKNLSQAQLANHCHLNIHYISKLERGIRRPSLTTLLKLAIVLDKPLSHLFIEVDKNVSWKYLVTFSTKYQLFKQSLTIHHT